MLSALTPGEARALAAPSRQRIAHFLADAPEGATVSDLTAHLGFNHNAVRKHLAQLVDAGIVVEAVEKRASRGRPHLRYRLAPRARGGNPYEQLAVLLATALASGEDPVDIGRRAASVEPASAPPVHSPIDRLSARFAADGFEPTIRAKRSGRADIVLGRCPYAAAAAANPVAVCGLHLGLAEGTAAGVGGVEVTGLVAKDPYRGGCRIAVHTVTGEQTGQS